MVRWGILGAGRVAASFTAPLEEVPGAALGAVASRQPERARSLAALSAGSARVHASYEALVHDPAVDVVYVATTANAHRELCLLALEAGKPVLCEKPFALDAAEARKVAAAARAHALFCEARWMRFTPAARELRAMVDSNRTGRPLFVSASLGFNYRLNPADRLFDPERGGGALLELGVYPISLVVWLLGKPEHVRGRLVTGSTGVDEQAPAVLGFGSGAQAQIAASIRVRLGNDAVVSGDAAVVRIEEPPYCPEPLRWVGARTIELAPQEGLRRSVRDRAPRWAKRLVAGLRIRRSWKPVRGQGLGHQIEEVHRCLAVGERESPLMPLEQSVLTLEVVDAVRACSRAST